MPRGGQTRHLAEDQHGRALEAEPLGMSGKLGDGREHAALVVAARILDGDAPEGAA